MGLVVFLHITICILLITIILIQAGRGGGLVESFSSVESMFGTKTNAFLTRATTVLSTAFFITCLTLAFLSAVQSRSLMPKSPVQNVTPAASGAAAEPVTPENTVSQKDVAANVPEQKK